MASPAAHDGEYQCEVSNTECNQVETISVQVRVTGKKPLVTSQYFLPKQLRLFLTFELKLALKFLLTISLPSY